MQSKSEDEFYAKIICENIATRYVLNSISYLQQSTIYTIST